MDIALAFGTLDAPGSFTGTGPGARAASATLMGAFTHFARNGDPNGAPVPRWPQYRLPQRATLLVDANSRAADDPRRPVHPAGELRAAPAPLDTGRISGQKIDDTGFSQRPDRRLGGNSQAPAGEDETRRHGGNPLLRRPRRLFLGTG